jgi:Family of unknown function (DUF6159)
MRGLVRGWRMARRSIGILRGEPSLAAFPALAAVTCVGAVALLAAPGVAWALATGAEWPLVPFAALAAYGAAYCALYFNVALAVAVAASLDGNHARLRDGLAGARSRRGAIARWALLQTTVGIVLQALQAQSGRAAIPLVTRLAGASWAIATFFAVPVLAFEGLGPKHVMKRSAGLVRERWGEGAGGSGAIALAVLLVGLVPAAACVALAAAIGGTAGPAVLVAIAAVLVIGAAVTGAALSVIFRVALYLDGSTGLYPLAGDRRYPAALPAVGRTPS